MIPQKHLEMVRMGLRNLVGYPMRTVLTMLGVVFGVGSVIAMLALGAGAERELLKEIGRLGIQNIIINSIKPEEPDTSSQRSNWINSYGITFKDHRQIVDTIPGIERAPPGSCQQENRLAGESSSGGNPLCRDTRASGYV